MAFLHRTGSMTGLAHIPLHYLPRDGFHLPASGTVKEMPLKLTCWWFARAWDRGRRRTEPESTVRETSVNPEVDKRLVTPTLREIARLTVPLRRATTRAIDKDIAQDFSDPFACRADSRLG